MTTLISSIMTGIYNFPFFAVLFTLPIFAVQLLKYKKLNPARILLNYAMVLYFLCLLALVFFPLPDPEVAATLHTHYIQLIPCHFIADIVRETPFQLSDPHTYLPALFHDTILQYLFNIMMLVPFGMFLRYYAHMSQKKIILCSFLLSLFIEIGQLTGLFFLFSGSYRFCDVDDLIANTLGGYLGYRLILLIEQHIPVISFFDLPAIQQHALRVMKPTQNPARM